MFPNEQTLSHWHSLLVSIDLVSLQYDSKLTSYNNTWTLNDQT